MSRADEPAFPIISSFNGDASWVNGIGEKVHSIHSTPGISKREYFAGLALQGLCSQITRTCPSDDGLFVIRESVYLADALLIELEKKK